MNPNPEENAFSVSQLLLNAKAVFTEPGAQGPRRTLARTLRAAVGSFRERDANYAIGLARKVEGLLQYLEIPTGIEEIDESEPESGEKPARRFLPTWSGIRDFYRYYVEGLVRQWQFWVGVEVLAFFLLLYHLAPPWVPWRVSPPRPVVR